MHCSLDPHAFDNGDITIHQQVSEGLYLPTRQRPPDLESFNFCLLTDPKYLARVMRGEITPAACLQARTLEGSFTFTAETSPRSLNLRYFDSLGQSIASELDDRTIGLTLHEIRQIELVVGVAGGSAKYKAIQTALKGKLIDVFVTDHVTAQQLLNQKELMYSSESPPVLISSMKTTKRLVTPSRTRVLLVP